ncbi:two-partner secretion domain-containing protein, partial [Perlucidibaca aquatica]|uniref:two-partner secretion domain-containing protein n=1 Tax=Perlucidibaca aquatica TaxID=1852776 RepID=UPI00083A0402
MSRQKNKTKSLKQNIIAIASTGLGSAGCVSLAFALPGGGTIVTGGISIGVAGNNMTITQADSKGIINWGVGGTQGAVGSSGFNINAGELVNFVQSAGPGAVTLNRDLSGALSNISGMLTANGNVFLVNPAGVVFGGGSTVNVGGLLATTANITNDDFLGTDGTAKFAFTGNHAGEIEAALGSSISAGKGGTNSAQSGTGAFVYLIAPTVETNGDIKTHVVTQIGQVTLAAADKFEVELSGSGLINFAINPSAVANANFKVDQKGSIETQQVLLTADQATSIQTSVVNNDGVIEATQLVDIAADTVIQNGAIAADVTVTPPVAPSTSPSYTVNTKTTAMKVKAGKSITTGASSKTAATTLTLQTTTKEAHIGGSVGINNGDDTTPVTFDADTIHAVTNRGHIYLKDTAGGVTVGEVDTGITAPTSGDPVSFGTSVILNAVGGGIRGGKLDSNIPNFRRRANTFNLNADGDIGNSPTDSLGLDTTTLLASTRNGHIYVNNQGDLALGKLQITEPVVTINNGQPLVAFVGASDQGNGRVRIPDGSDAGRLGVKDIVVSAGGDIVLTNTISATRNLTLNSGKSVQAVPAGTQQPVNTLLTGVQVTVSADGSVGNVGQALKTNAENVSINATKGSVYINEQNGLSSISVTAQDDIYVSADSGNISLGALSTNKNLDSIKDSGAPTAAELEDVVSVIAKRGNIQSGVGSLIISEALELNAIDFIGTAASPIQFTGVERLLVINNGVNAGTFLAGNSASVKSIDATIKGGDFSLSESGVDALRYIALTETLNLNRLIAGPVRFINESTSLDRQDIKIAAGTGAGVGGLLTLKTEGSVSRASGVLTAGSINVTADKGIDLAVATGSAVLATKFGDINLDTTSNSASTTLTLDAQTLAANKNITVKTTGDLSVQRAQSLGAVTLEASTHLADLVNAQISGLSLSAKAASVGSVSDVFDTNIDGPISVTASSGGIYLSNTGNVGSTGFNAQATGDIDFKNNGDVAFGKVETTTGNINVAITGDGTDAHVNAPDLVNFSAVMGSNGLTYAAKSMGVVGNRLEINVSKLVVDTTSGGIYAINDNNTAFSLIRAKASGAEANIDIETKGNLALGTVESRGNNVKLTAASKITDARTQDQKNLKTPNVRSKSLDLKAGNGVDDLLLDVNFISAAGGAGEVKATNQGAVSLDRASLENKSVSIKATEIYVIDLDGTVNLAPAGTINLEATDGNIVFLDPTNTLVMGSGHITLTAKTGASVPGAGGVIIAGNLKTNGNIKLSADSNITINELNAGAGDVSVASNKGIIIDGNGAAHNITGANVSLSASTPTVKDAEIRRERAIAEFSANQAEVGALTTLKKTSETTLESTKNSENTIKTTLSIAENNQRTTQNNFNSKNAQAEALGGELEDLQLALEAAGVAVDVLEIGVGAAQAVPFSGDAGATAAFAIVRLALSAASLAVTVFEREELAPVEAEVTSLRALLSTANSNVFSTKNLLAKATSDRQAAETNVQTVVEDLNKATIALIASQRVDEQANAAEALNKDIDSNALKPLGITAQRLDINQGTTVNTSVFLDSTGSLGLGDISLKAGEDLFVNAAGNISQVGQTVVKADGLNRGFMSIKAAGSISDAGPNTAGQFLADDLIMVAGAGVGAGDAVDIQAENLSVTGGSGGVNVANTTALVSGSPRYAALNITTVAGQSGINGDGDITLTTDGDMNLFGLVSDTNLMTNHTVTLTSANGSLVDKNMSDINVRANALIASAKNDINLDTDINALTATTSAMGTGHITIDEVSSLTIKSADAGNGNVTVSADGDMTVESIKARDSVTDDTAGMPAVPRVVGNVSLTAKGTAPSSAGFIRDDGSQLTVIDATELTLSAKADVGGTTAANDEAARSLDTKVESVVVDASGVVNLTDADDLIVTRVTTQGDVTLQSVAGSLKVGEITTAVNDTTPTTTVTLFATAGSVTDQRTEAADATTQLTNITADRLAIKAKSGIGSALDDLNVKVAVLEAETSTGGVNITDQSGDLKIDDVIPGLKLALLDGVRATSTTMGTTGGDITLKVENGSLNQQREVSTTAGDISLTAKNSVTIGSILKSLLGKIGVKAETGSITTEGDAPISATKDVTLLADTDIV